MGSKQHATLERSLRDRRKHLFDQVAETEADLQFIAEDRESELEERAQEERAAVLFERLDLRGKRAIEEIDAALVRLRDGTYGTCIRCAEQIPLPRLKALPATAYCVECAGALEKGSTVGAAEVAEAEADVITEGSLPADLRGLTDREITDALRELIASDDRLDLEELRLVCRRGVVHLDGAVPSETEHRILLKLITDVAGLTEVVDHLQVQGLLWDREDRSPAEQPAPPDNEDGEPADTDDVVQSVEEGLDYAPPFEPPAEPEK